MEESRDRQRASQIFTLYRALKVSCLQTLLFSTLAEAIQRDGMRAFVHVYLQVDIGRVLGQYPHYVSEALVDSDMERCTHGVVQ